MLSIGAASFGTEIMKTVTRIMNGDEGKRRPMTFPPLSNFKTD